MPRLLLALLLLACCTSLRAVPPAKDDDAYAPHTPTLLFHLVDLAPADVEALRAALTKVPSVRKVAIDAAKGSAQVRFDSHVVSYHQVAQAITEAGKAAGKSWDPSLEVQVPEYPQPGNAAKVDALFAGKRLRQRVDIKPLDPATGRFTLHFLPLVLDPAEHGPQGFNGGHLNHPLHDPPPRGLGLTCIYAAGDAEVKAP